MSLPDYTRATSVITDIKGDIRNLTAYESNYLTFMELMIKAYRERYDGQEIFDQLCDITKKIGDRDQIYNIEFENVAISGMLCVRLFDNYQEFLNLSKEWISNIGKFSEDKVDQCQLLLDFIELRSIIVHGDDSEKSDAMDQFLDIANICLNEEYFELLYNEIGRFKAIRPPDKYLKKFADHLKDQFQNVSELQKPLLLLYIGSLYKQYIGLSFEEEENKLWKNELMKALELTEGLKGLDRESKFHHLQIMYQLGQYIGWYNISNFDGIIDEQYLLDIIEVGNEFNAKYEAGTAQIRLGKIYASNEQWELAEKYLEPGLEILARYGEKNDYLYETLAELQGKLGKSDLEIENLKNTIINRMKPPFSFYCGNEKSWLDASIVSSITKLCDKYRDSGHINNAVYFLNELVSKDYMTDFNTVKARARLELADLLFENGEYREAIERSQESLKISQKLGYTVQYVRSLNQLAHIHYKEGNRDRALEYWKDTFLRYQYWLIETSSIVKIFDFIDLFDRPEKNLDLELSYHKHILDTLSVQDSLEQYLFSLANIAVIHQDRNQWQKAIEYWKKVHELAIKYDNSTFPVISSIKISEIESILGNIDTSVSYYEKSGEMLKYAINSLPDWGWMYSSSQFLYAPIGKLTLVPEDDPNYEEKEETENSNDEGSLLSRNYVTEAMVWIKRFKFQKAQNCLNKALSSDNKEDRVNASYLLSRMEQRKGNHTTAKKYIDLIKNLVKDKYIFGKEDWHISRREGFIENLSKLEEKLNFLELEADVE